MELFIATHKDGSARILEDERNAALFARDGGGRIFAFEADELDLAELLPEPKAAAQVLSAAPALDAKAIDAIAAKVAEVLVRAAEAKASKPAAPAEPPK